MMLKKLPFILLLFVAALPACTKVDMNFGGEIVDENYTQIVKVDTFNVSMSTVYLDSFATSSKGVMLLGGYTDTAFGRIDTKCFFELAPPTAPSDGWDNTYFDSLSLIIKTNKTFYGDTTKPVHIDIYQLNQLITPPDNGVNLFNNESFTVSNLLGSGNILVAPNIMPDTISIRMNDAFGKQLLAKLQDPTDLDMKTSAAFINNFLNGVRVSSNSSAQAIFGFSDSVKVRLSYKKAGLYILDKYVDFTLVNKNHQFNNITADRTGTPLQNLQNAREIPSALTHNVAFSQPASCAMMKIRFPNIRDLLNFPHFAKILKANLIVKPEINSYDRNFYLPPQLRLSTTNYLNQVGSDLVITSSTGSAVVQYGSLVLDYNNGNTYYSYDLSAYLKSIINDPNYNYTVSGLLLTPPSPAYESQFGRVIAGDSKNPLTVNQIQLQIYYATVQ